MPEIPYYTEILGSPLHGLSFAVWQGALSAKKHLILKRCSGSVTTFKSMVCVTITAMWMPGPKVSSRPLLTASHCLHLLSQCLLLPYLPQVNDTHLAVHLTRLPSYITQWSSSDSLVIIVDAFGSKQEELWLVCSYKTSDALSSINNINISCSLCCRTSVWSVLEIHWVV